MKIIHLIALLIVLAVGGGLIGTQRQKISRLEDKSAVLRERIAAEKSRINSRRDGGGPLRPASLGGKDEGIDWLEAAEMSGSGGGVRGTLNQMALQAIIQKMDEQQLFAALEEIGRLGLSGRQKMALERMLIIPLAQKDPELLFRTLSYRFDSDRLGLIWHLGAALGEWVKKDHATATAWFDDKIAAGIFDSESLNGRSELRLNFERSLINQLVFKDAEAAKARIAALPADQRKAIFTGVVVEGMAKEEQAAHAQLVREALPEGERFDILGRHAWSLERSGGLEKVDSYLEVIGATGEERAKVVERVASGKLVNDYYYQKVTEKAVDSIREWVGRQAPGSVDRVTGESLGKIAAWRKKTSYPEAVAMVLKYHEQGGSDDLLIGFLNTESHGRGNEEAMKVAERISDPTMREEALERLK